MSKPLFENGEPQELRRFSNACSSPTLCHKKKCVRPRRGDNHCSKSKTVSINMNIGMDFIVRTL